MKFIVFNVREDEEIAFQEYINQHQEIQFTLIKEILSENNVDLLKNDFNAVIVSQIQKIPDIAYEYMQKYGVKVMATRSAGYDMYDLVLLKKHNIRLVRVPSYSPFAIAEYAFSSAMYFSRNFHLIQNNVSNLDFSWNPNILSVEMRNKTVGILGTGNIGLQSAKLFHAVGAKVLGYDKFENPKAKNILEYSDLETIFKTCDVISIHMPATSENYHLFNTEVFKKCKSNLILINTARGSIVDTSALIHAIETKQIFAAAIDTYEYEGMYVNQKHTHIEDELLNKMLQNPNILYSPHIAFYTTTAIQQLVHIALEAARKVLLNKEVMEEVIL